MQDQHQEHRKHVAFWVAVSGTSAIVVALWAMILPTQLRRIRLSAQQDKSRWGVVEDTQAKEKVKPFAEIMAEQRATLDEIEKRAQPNDTAIAPNTVTSKIEDLRAKIEAAAQKHSSENSPQNIPVEPTQP